MIKGKHLQQAFDGFVHFCGVRGVGISGLSTSQKYLRLYKISNTNSHLIN